MKSIVLATLLATTAFAASAMPVNGEIYGHDAASTTTHTMATVSKTRAEVIAELHQAEAAGALAYGESSIKRPVGAMSAADRLTRAEVRMDISGLGTHGSVYRN